MQSGKGLISGSQRNINHLLGVEIQGKNWGKESGSVKHLWPMYRYFHLVTAHEPQVFKGSWYKNVSQLLEEFMQCNIHLYFVLICKLPWFFLKIANQNPLHYCLTSLHFFPSKNVNTSTKYCRKSVKVDWKCIGKHKPYFLKLMLTCSALKYLNALKLQF